MEKKVDYGPIGSSLVVMLLFGGVGYFVGDLLGAFVGSCFAYTTWWLKDIHDTLHKDKSNN